MKETSVQDLMDAVKRQCVLQDKSPKEIILDVLDILDEIVERDRTRSVYDHSR